MQKEVGTPPGNTGKVEQKRDKPSWGSRSYNVGAASCFLSTLATFPIYKTIFRQQLHAFSIREAVRQLTQEGLRKFYRGVFPPLLSKTLQGTLMFGTYENCLHILSSQSSGPYSLGDRYTAGLMSGVSEALVLAPFERIQNILQDGRKNKRFLTTRSILQEFHSYALRERLLLGYYRGLGLILVRNSLGSSLYFSLKDPLRDSLSERGLPHWLPALVSGSVNGMLICLFLYPLSVLIANVQSQVGKQEMLHFPASVTAVWAKHGRRVGLLYRGGSLLILRSCITWGLTTAIYDFLQENTV
ncbi:PREDICTED: solute carrier family 25 member 53 [Gekko japonicus]|uniref:Solute carrier family 25 member 53 n=1 Tax=Gekko japonicus TaxID=146911 RepID=A0ABM1JSI8_GEKJA|nr:PREDICTED: solute carrier family 25 member 53 [Gekko japonicus]